MIRAFLNVSVSTLLAGGGASAQSTDPALEVASVRKHVGQQGGVARFTLSGSRVTIVALDLYDLILEAYALKDYQLYGAKGWMGGGKNLSDIVTRERVADFYDISAKAEGDAALTRDQARLILQRVLADRFRLKVHHETRNLPVYALMIGKNGPKLKESSPDAKFASGFELGSSARITNKEDANEPVCGIPVHSREPPGFNRTGLTGFYDFTLEWSPPDDAQQSTLATAGVSRNADSAGPSLFTAVQEQLGLELETSKAPIEVVVIDNADRPSEN
jgi:uncharacterized protein (TIGR03435 family)